MTLQSTVASIQNIRKQRQLELELVELDRRWHVELKVMARERLGLIKDLCRISQQQREMDHFQATLHGKDLTRFTDKAQDRRQHDKELRQLHKFNFQPDPVDKMNLHLPPIKREGDEGGGDVAQVLTAKDLYKQRVQLQKTNFDQCMADRRNRRRPFWDKAVIGTRKKQLQREQHGVFRQRARMFGFNGLVLSSTIASEENKVDGEEKEEEEKNEEEKEEKDEDEELRSPRGLSKSPSLPALNNLRRLVSDSVPTVHPSLSSRHSASLDYLPVIRGTRGQHGLLATFKAAAPSASALPTIAEG